MKPFSLLGRVLFYPFIRAKRDVVSSATSVSETVGAIKDVRKRRQEDAIAATNYLKGMTDEEKFVEVSTLNGWTEAKLINQETAVRRTRRAVVIVGALGSVFLIALMVNVNVFLMALVGTLIVMMVSSCFAMAVRYAWWEYQLSSRSLVSMKKFLARDDLIERVLL